MTIEGSLNSAMQTLSSLYSGEVGGAIAVKVLKDQMDQQQQLKQVGDHITKNDLIATLGQKCGNDTSDRSGTDDGKLLRIKLGFVSHI